MSSEGAQEKQSFRFWKKRSSGNTPGMIRAVKSQTSIPERDENFTRSVSSESYLKSAQSSPKVDPEARASVSIEEKSATINRAAAREKTTTTSTQSPPQNRVNAQSSRLRKIMDAKNLDLGKLRKSCWNGVPAALRSEAWKLLLGYLPTNHDRRETTLKKRRAEYAGFVEQYYKVGAHQRTEQEQKTLAQILVDVPRTCPELSLFREEYVRESLTQLLYIWSIRHPATGYVQGINDLATPFLYIFYSEALDGDLSRPVASLSADTLFNAGADTFWCLSKLLEGIQDHYIFAQPGLQRMVFKLQELTNRIDLPLYNHLSTHNVLFIQFAFRWMNCLLLREIALSLIVRVWDTYLSCDEETDLTDFHIYVCAALLRRFSKTLLTMDFQEVVMFLQRLPTEDWGVQDIESLLSEAYVLQSLYHNAQSHLR
eukprot:107403_1